MIRRSSCTLVLIWLLASCPALYAQADGVPASSPPPAPTVTATTPPARPAPPAHDPANQIWLDSIRRLSKLSIAPSYQQGPTHLSSVQAGGLLGGHASSGPGDPGALLATHREHLLGYQRVELSRLDYALRGAGTAATSAMFMGAMANSAGLWDEETSWYIVGAASALGALLGGTVGTPDDPGARIEVRLEP